MSDAVLCGSGEHHPSAHLGWDTRANTGAILESTQESMPKTGVLVPSGQVLHAAARAVSGPLRTRPGAPLSEGQQEVRLALQEKEMCMPNWLLSLTLARAVLGATLLVGCGSASSSARKPISNALREAFVPIPRGEEIFSPFVFAVPPNAMTAWQHAHHIKTFRDPRPFLNPQAFSLTTAWLKVSTSFPQPRRGRASDSAHALIEKDLFQEGGIIGSTCGSPQA